MTNRSLFLILSLVAASSLMAQVPEKKEEARPVSVLSVTVILRATGSNVPGKYTSYLSSTTGAATLPLHDPNEVGWIAVIDTDLDGKNGPTFSLTIKDTSRLQSWSSEETPNFQQPVDVLRVYLPFTVGAEVPVYKSAGFSVAVVFESE